MKKVLLILLFLGIVSGSYSQTSVYHPFPTHDAIWREYSGYSPIPNYQAFEYVITGDTILSDTIYHKLMRITAYYPIDLTGGPILDSLGDAYQSYYGAFKEDTLLKKIYLKVPGTNTRLLYDFNMELGDTLTHVNHGNHTWVSTVDSILIGSDYRRRIGIAYETDTIPYVYLIEGIGSTSGLVEPIDILFEFYSVLYCFTQNGVHLYQSSNMNSTCDYLAVKEYKSNLSFSISPNPFSTTTQITLAQTYHTIFLSVYDMQGKLVAQNQYTNCDKIQLNRNTLTNGMYFLKLTMDDKEITTGKIVVSD